jgi:hypothetical protein
MMQTTVLFYGGMAEILSGGEKNLCKIYKPIATANLDEL